MYKIIYKVTAFISLLVIFLVSGIAVSQEEFLATGMSSLPEISASFTIEVIPSDHKNNKNYSRDILVWRSQNLFEIQHTNTSFGEYWNLLKNGRVRYSWVHHNRKFIVNHEPSFFNSPEAGLLYWESKATFINKKFLAKLSKIGESDYKGYPSEQYEGTVNGEFISVNWLPTLSLPVSIEQTRADDKYSIKLKEIYPLGNSQLTPINADKYRDLDYVDFEDEQTDPDVQFYLRVLNKEGHIH